MKKQANTNLAQLKKFLGILLAILFAVSVLALPAAAAEAEYEDELNIDLVATFSQHPKEDFYAYFRNVDTDEVIRFTLRGNLPNRFPVLAEFTGTYKLEKCVLAKNPRYEYGFEGKVDDLTLRPGEIYTLYVFRLAETPTVHTDPVEYSEYTAYHLAEGVHVEEDAQVRKKANKAVLIIGLVTLVYPLVWIIIAIQGRRNFYKRVVAQLMKHLFIAFWSFVLGIVFSGALSNFINPFITIVFCTCFPFGVIGVLARLGGYIEAPSPEEIRDMQFARSCRTYDENSMCDSISVTLWVLLLLVCGLIGIVALPVILIKDVCTVIKCRPLNFKY